MALSLHFASPEAHVIVRLGSLLTGTLVILSVLSWVHDSGLPRNTQVSTTLLEMESRSRSRETTDLDPIAMTSQFRRNDDVADSVDLYGNEVTAAVATYELDRTGALYELHSPQTEVPQLPPPKS